MCSWEIIELQSFNKGLDSMLVNASTLVFGIFLNSTLILFHVHRGSVHECSQSVNLCRGAWSLRPYRDLFWKQHARTCKHRVCHRECSSPKGAKMKRAWSQGRGLKGEWKKSLSEAKHRLPFMKRRVKGRVTREQVCNKRSWEEDIKVWDIRFSTSAVLKGAAFFSKRITAKWLSYNNSHNALLRTNCVFDHASSPGVLLRNS